MKTAALCRVRGLRIRRRAPSFFSRLLLFVMLLGLSFVILFPFYAKVSASFMSRSDLYDATVSLVPRKFVLDNYRAVLEGGAFVPALLRTMLFALACGLCAAASSALVGYGLGRYRFRGSNLLYVLVVLTMLIPVQTLSLPLYSTFNYMDFFGIVKALRHRPGLTGTVWPFVLLSSTCLGFRGGIFVILMRQFFRNIPGELVEAARVDGAGHIRTFVRIVLPMAKSMLVVVFILAFAWQWTDTYYTGLFMGSDSLLPSLILGMTKSVISSSPNYYYDHVLANTALIMTILPLLIIYVIFQRKIIAGIERSGLVE